LDVINFTDRYLIATWGLQATNEDLKEILTNAVHKLENKTNLNHIDISQLSQKTLDLIKDILFDLNFLGDRYIWKLEKGKKKTS